MKKKPHDGFENHQDNISPAQVLKNRKLQIDKAIQRMDNVGTRGEFYDHYVSLSVSFDSAIILLEKHEKEPDPRWGT